MQTYTNIEYFNCPIPKHKKQPLARICLDPSCLNSSLICYSCEKQSHSNHNTLSLQEFFENQEERRFGDTINQPIKSLMATIKEQKTKALEQLILIRQKLMKEFDNNINKTEKYFNELLFKFESLLKKNRQTLCNPVFTQYNRNNRLQQVLQDLKQQLKRYVLYEGGCHQIQEKVQKILITMPVYLNSFKQLNDDALQTITLVPNLFPIPMPLNLLPHNNSSIQFLNFRWDSQLKHRDIDCTGLLAKRVRSQLGGVSVGVLGNMKLNELGKVYRWEIRIGSDNRYHVCIGMCLESQAKRLKFWRNWDTLGHGHYVIYGNKQVFSHSNAAINEKQLSFKFNKSDKLVCEYDTLQNILSIWKSNEQKEFWSFAVQPAPNNDCYRPCAYIYSVGESVEILPTAK